MAEAQSIFIREQFLQHYIAQLLLVENEDLKAFIRSRVPLLFESQKPVSQRMRDGQKMINSLLTTTENRDEVRRTVHASACETFPAFTQYYSYFEQEAKQPDCVNDWIRFPQ